MQTATIEFRLTRYEFVSCPLMLKPDHMQKVYLLLRNNKQTGPHSQDELVKMGLKPFDLIWVEGKSFGWSYPSEIESLRPFLTSSLVNESKTSIQKEVPESHMAYLPPSKTERPSVENKKVFVSLPYHKAVESPSEIRKEPVSALSEPMIAPLDRTDESEIPPVTTTRVARSVHDMEEDYTNWVFKQKTKRRSPARKFGALAILLLLAGILYGINNWLYPSVQTQKEGVAHVVTAENPVISEPLNPSSGPIADLSPEEIKGPQQELIQSDVTTGAPIQVKKKHAAGKATQSSASGPLVQSVLIDAPSVATEERTAGHTAARNNPPVNEKEEKKGLRKLLANVLENKEPGKDVEEPAAKKAETSATGERTAIRREENSIAENKSPDLAPNIRLTDTKAGDAWMMGVVGHKLNIRNNNRETVEAAVVEIQYLDETENLLEKKTVTVNHITPGRTLTITVPDHRLADHAVYRLLSVKGK